MIISLNGYYSAVDVSITEDWRLKTPQDPKLDACTIPSIESPNLWSIPTPMTKAIPNNAPNYSFFRSKRYQSSQPKGTFHPSQMKRDFQQQYPQSRLHSNPPLSLNPRNEPSVRHVSENKNTLGSLPRANTVATS